MSVYQEQLHDLFEEQDEVQQIRGDERWSVKDMSAAMWVDSILHEKEQKIEELTSIYNERKEKMIQKLDEWLEQSVKPLKNDIEFFETHLKVYQANVIAEERAKGAKKESKTIKLAHRDLKLTKQQPEILINGKEPTKAKNDPVLLGHVKVNNPEFIKEEVAWGDYKKTLEQKNIDGKLAYIDADGNFLDFITLIERGEEYSVKTKKDN